MKEAQENTKLKQVEQEITALDKKIFSAEADVSATTTQLEKLKDSEDQAQFKIKQLILQ